MTLHRFKVSLDELQEAGTFYGFKLFPNRENVPNTITVKGWLLETEPAPTNKTSGEYLKVDADYMKDAKFEVKVGVAPKTSGECCPNCEGQLIRGCLTNTCPCHSVTEKKCNAYHIHDPSYCNGSVTAKEGDAKPCCRTCGVGEERWYGCGCKCHDRPTSTQKIEELPQYSVTTDGENSIPLGDEVKDKINELIRAWNTHTQ